MGTRCVFQLVKGAEIVQYDEIARSQYANLSAATGACSEDTTNARTNGLRRLLKGNVGLLTRLRPSGGGRPLLVANTHLVGPLC
eukprot:SAG31_NODE_4525_length_3165_cov_1.986301_2_plen_84_part_00